MDYDLMESQWKSSLYECDSESCLLSILLPCHIYSKFKSNGNYYLLNFLSYGFVLICINNIYYWFSYYNKHECPSKESSQCFGLTDCQNNYIYIDNIPTKCIYYEDAQICAYNKVGCILKKDLHELNKYLWFFCSVSYLFLFIMNYSLRNKIRNNKQIKSNACIDLCAVTVCYTCGLAQEYRENN